VNTTTAIAVSTMNGSHSEVIGAPRSMIPCEIMVKYVSGSR